MSDHHDEVAQTPRPLIDWEAVVGVMASEHVGRLAADASLAVVQRDEARRAYAAASAQRDLQRTVIDRLQARVIDLEEQLVSAEELNAANNALIESLRLQVRKPQARKRAPVKRAPARRSRGN